jgi:sulfane dehydrogenase subunit SoxC
VKWLTQIKLTREPTHFRDETSKYTDTRLDRKSQQFTFPMGTKSVITAPSGQMKLERQGIYQVTGIAWSGRGSIRRVEVSADGGRTWADAMIDSHQSEKALARFRIPWQWSGGDAVLQSRATDSQGNVQPTRTSLVTEKGNISTYHFHGIQSWAINTAGDVSNVYA